MEGIKKKVGVITFLRSNLPPNPNIIKNKYILCIKYPGTQTQRFKARCILLGHLDKLPREISNNSPMLMRLSFLMIISFAVLFFMLVLWLRDLEHSYTQATRVLRDVFTEAPPEAKLPEKNLLKVLLPHYGLVESSSCFFETYYPVFVNTMGMQSAVFDPFFLH